ncbi:hypothetical protein PBI_SHIBA_72 [Arthrobacter phage Shiba]|nr:hypothetical protein PBI_SHIBA_72 [Arthrobacter phage Shiba]
MEPVVIITVPVCGAKEIHNKHVLRHGFLHLRRLKCEGWSVKQFKEYQRMMYERDIRATQTLYKKHKHSFKFLGAEEGQLTFVCKSPKCGTYCHWSRWIFDYRTLNTPEDFGLHKDRDWCGKGHSHLAHRFWIDNKNGTVSRRHCHGLTDRMAKYFSGSMA